MTAQHTPGPWHVSNGVQVRSERHQIAKVWMMRNGEGSANAKLIAAAPDLLLLARRLEVALPGDLPTLIAEARAAVAKATD